MNYTLSSEFLRHNVVGFVFAVFQNVNFLLIIVTYLHAPICHIDFEGGRRSRNGRCATVRNNKS